MKKLRGPKKNLYYSDQKVIFFISFIISPWFV